MLIKVTNFCSMGCSHCMENSTVAGEHMTRETFTKALDLSETLEVLAWLNGCPPQILLSGGECTEHPEIVSLIEEVWDRNWMVTLITNGMWLGTELRDQILKHPKRKENLFVQVTNDERFYPSKPPKVDDPRVAYVDKLTVFLPLGRGKPERAKGVPTRTAPSSFNFRSATIGLGDVRLAIAQLRFRAWQGKSGHCAPSISSDGSLVAGETSFCMKIGDVNSTPEQITRAVVQMGSCNRCGLETDLPQAHKVAIGIARIHPR